MGHPENRAHERLLLRGGIRLTTGFSKDGLGPCCPVVTLRVQQFEHSKCESVAAEHTRAAGVGGSHDPGGAGRALS
jgi:hypothetical protein